MKIEYSDDGIGRDRPGGAEGDWQKNSQAKVPVPDETPKTKGACAPADRRSNLLPGAENLSGKKTEACL